MTHTHIIFEIWARRSWNRGASLVGDWVRLRDWLQLGLQQRDGVLQLLDATRDRRQLDVARLRERRQRLDAADDEVVDEGQKSAALQTVDGRVVEARNNSVETPGHRIRHHKSWKSQSNICRIDVWRDVMVNIAVQLSKWISCCVYYETKRK